MKDTLQPESRTGVSPSAPSASSGQASGEIRRIPPWATVIATFFGIGQLRPGPGTWGSLATVLLWAALAHTLSPSLRTPVAIALAVLVTLIAIPAATRVARGAGKKIPSLWSLMKSQVN